MPQETHRRSLEEIERDNTEFARLAKQSPAAAQERRFTELCEKYFATEVGSKEAVDLVRQIRDAANSGVILPEFEERPSPHYGYHHGSVVRERPSN